MRVSATNESPENLDLSGGKKSENPHQEFCFLNEILEPPIEAEIKMWLAVHGNEGEKDGDEENIKT